MSFFLKNTPLKKIYFSTTPSPERSLFHKSKHKIYFFISSIHFLCMILECVSHCINSESHELVSNWHWSSYLFSIYFRRSFFTQTCHGCCLFFILTNKQQWIEHNKFLLKGLCHACLVTIAYNGSFFTRKLDICQEFSCKWQKQRYASNKYLSQNIISNVTNNKNDLWETVRLTN